MMPRLTFSRNRFSHKGHNILVGMLLAVALCQPMTIRCQTSEKIIKAFCQDGQLPEAFCANDGKTASKLDIVQAWMQKMAQDAAGPDEEYTGIYGPEVYALSQNYWVKGDSAAFADFPPPHPDTLKKLQQDCRRILALLQKHQFVPELQATEIQAAIKTNQILHPWYVLGWAAAFLVEAELEGPFFARLADSLQVVFPGVDATAKDFNRFLSTIPEQYPLVLNEAILSPEALKLCVEKMLGQMYPALKPALEWRLSTEGFNTLCQIPIRRYDVIYGLKGNGAKNCEWELAATRVDEQPMIEAGTFLTNENFVSFLLQTETDLGSQYRGILLLNKLNIRNLLLNGLGLPEIENEYASINIGRFHVVRLPEQAVERLKKMHIPFADPEVSLDLERCLFARKTTGLTTGDKNRIWQKVVASTLMDRYTVGAREYIWANLSSYPITDSLEMLRQMFLADFPDPFTRLRSVNQLFETPIRNLYQLNFMKDLARGAIKTGDFADFKLEKAVNGAGMIFRFSCMGKPFQTPPSGNDGTVLDLVVLQNMARAWRETHPGERSFYYIYGTQYLLFLSELEAEKFSEVFHLLLRPC